MYYVDGIPVNNEVEANILADRLFKRYKHSKTIVITHDGIQVGVRPATKPVPARDQQTEDMFS